ncbi:exopolysaccharide Pel transporter PelG [Mesobacillus subterraneus]|uniref:exopolysaccharide Pel transporter PelG n=1 Tax=Mesobacillus subterraneus TaxID=285983 RepID=UPI001CFEAF58|nr:exopolysaccharide Pel transporter PelG [Mesobacillus subterraneus]WLR54467.1 exopolysaccharide Pel transporter PelG [Mesobacillus subterraneus]
MAGVGFELQKLFHRRSVANQLRAYGYSALATVGPMAFCIGLIALASQILEYAGTSFLERERFMAAAEYAFVFSQLVTGGFNLVISRYIADESFVNRPERVLSSLFGLVAMAVMIGGSLAYWFYWSSPLPLTFKVVTYLFFIQLIVIWIQCMYVSAFKDYMKIVKSFFAGFIVSIVLILVTIFLFGKKDATSLFICLDIGFFIIMAGFMRYILLFFRVNDHDYFHFFIYLEKHPFLFLAGFFYTLGLFGHTVVAWFGEYQHVVDQTFYIAPYYDVPVFYAYLTILTAMIMFIVAVETKFYTVYRKYYDRILTQSPLKEIIHAKKQMFKTIGLEISFIAEAQLLIVIAFMALGLFYLPRIGFTNEQIYIYLIVTLGYYFFSIFYTMFHFILYFDDKKGAMISAGTYALLSVFFTVIILYTGHYGLSVFLAGAVAVVITGKRLTFYLNELDYYTFCAQPLFRTEENYKVSKLLEKLKLFQ